MRPGEGCIFTFWHLYFLIEETKSQRDNVTHQRRQSESVGAPKTRTSEVLTFSVPHDHLIYYYIIIIKTKNDGKS